MIRRGLLALFMITAVALVPATAGMAIAAPQIRQVAACGTSVASFLGLEPWWSCLEKKYGQVELGQLSDIWLVVLVVLEDAIKLGGYIAVGFIIWGGIKYTKSQGNSSEIQQAQMVIKNAILGLVLTLLSVAMVEFVVAGLTRP